MTTELNNLFHSWLNHFRINDEILTYNSLKDAYFLNEIFRQIYPNAEVNFQLPSNYCITDKVKNWEILIKNIRIYYGEVLQQAVFLRLPNIVLICHEMNSKKSNEEIDKVISVILCAAAQCERKEYFMNDILSSLPDKSIIIALKEFTKQIMENVDIFINYENVSQLSATDLRNILEQREEVFFENSKTLLSEIDGLHHQLNVQKSQAPLMCGMGLDSVSSLELTECKAKLRKIQNDLDTKCDIVADLRCELDAQQDEKNKLKEVQMKLENESRRVRQLQDELDSQTDSVIRLPILKLENTKLKEKVTELEYYKTRCKELRDDLAILSNENTRLLNGINHETKDEDQILKKETVFTKGLYKYLPSTISDVYNNVSNLESDLQEPIEKCASSDQSLETSSLLNHSNDLNSDISFVKQSNLRCESELNMGEKLETEKEQIQFQNLELNPDSVIKNDFDVQKILQMFDLKQSDKNELESLKESIKEPDITISDSNKKRRGVLIKIKPKRRHSVGTKDQITLNDTLQKTEERNQALQRILTSMTVRDKELSNFVSEMNIKFQALEEKFQQEKISDSSLIVECKEEIANLKQNNVQLESEKQFTETQSQILKEKVSALENNLEILQTRCNDVCNQNIKVNVEKSTLKRNLVSLRNENKNLLDQISADNNYGIGKEELDQHKENINSLKTELDRQTYQNATLNAELDRQTSQNATLKTELDRQTSQNTTLRADLDRQTSQNTNLKTELDNKVTQISAIKSELDRQVSKNRNLKSELDSKSEDLQNIKQSYDSVKHHEELLENEKNSLIEDNYRQLTNLRYANSNIKNDYDILMQKCHDTEIELKDLIRDKHFFKSEQKRDKQEISRLKEIKDKIEKKMNEVETEVEKLAGRIQCLIDQNEELKITNTSLLYQMKSMLMQNQHLLAETLQHKQDYFTEENTLRNRINQLEWQKECLDAKIVEYSPLSPSVSRTRSFKNQKEERSIKRKDSGTTTDQETKELPKKKPDSDNGLIKCNSSNEITNVTRHLVKANSITLGYQRPQTPLGCDSKQTMNHSIPGISPPNLLDKSYSFEGIKPQRPSRQTPVDSNSVSKDYSITRLPHKKPITQYNPNVFLRNISLPGPDRIREESNWADNQSRDSPIKFPVSSGREPNLTRSKSTNERKCQEFLKKCEQKVPIENTPDSRPVSRTGSDLTRQPSTSRTKIPKNTDNICNSPIPYYPNNRGTSEEIHHLEKRDSVTPSRGIHHSSRHYKTKP